MTAVEDQELFSHLQPEIQKYIEDHGPLEKYKTPTSLKALLVNLRRDLVVPPWHPVTDYIRSFANACAVGRVDSSTFWCKNKTHPIGTLKSAEIGKQTWVYLRVFENRSDYGLAERSLCVEPFHGYIWDVQTEHMLSATYPYVSVDFDVKGNGKGHHKLRITVNRDLVLEKAKTLFDQGLFEGSLEYHSKRRKPKRSKVTQEKELPFEEPVKVEEHIQESKAEELEARKVKLPIFSEKSMAMLKFMHAIACKEYPSLVNDFNEVYAKVEELLK